MIFFHVYVFIGRFLFLIIFKLSFQVKDITEQKKKIIFYRLLRSCYIDCHIYIIINLYKDKLHGL